MAPPVWYMALCVFVSCEGKRYRQNGGHNLTAPIPVAIVTVSNRLIYFDTSWLRKDDKIKSTN
jgi:hypothetical protein